MSPRPSEEEREALRQAAVAAVPIMRKLADERARLDARIARLQAIVDGYEDLLGRPPRRAQNDDQPDSHPRGKAGAHVDAVLMEGGEYTGPMVVSDHTLSDGSITSGYYVSTT